MSFEMNILKISKTLVLSKHNTASTDFVLRKRVFLNHRKPLW